MKIYKSAENFAKNFFLLHTFTFTKFVQKPFNLCESANYLFIYHISFISFQCILLILLLRLQNKMFGNIANMRKLAKVTKS